MLLIPPVQQAASPLPALALVTSAAPPGERCCPVSGNLRELGRPSRIQLLVMTHAAS